MLIDKLKSFLKFQIIWKDDEMFEIKVTTSNTSFYGSTEVYDQSVRLSEFAESLKTFPENDKILFYEAGEKDSYAYFSMKYYSIDNYGNIGVEINLESNESTEFRKEEKNKLKLEIIVELSAIDKFQKALYHLAKSEEGSAILYGKGNRLDS